MPTCKASHSQLGMALASPSTVQLMPRWVSAPASHHHHTVEGIMPTKPPFNNCCMSHDVHGEVQPGSKVWHASTEVEQQQAIITMAGNLK